MTTFSLTDVGCYLDGARGVYIGEAIQQMAGHLGWKYSAQWEMVYIDDDTVDAEAYTWATDEAEDFLNTLTDDDVCFGPTESGDWGLWHICENELDCTICEGV